MIDCSKTKNYIAEKRRMTKTHTVDGTTYLCSIDCAKCPLHLAKNDLDDKMSCYDFEIGYPEKAIEIVQQWSDEHPQRTYLSEFLKNYPNALLTDDGMPTTGCPYRLGLIGIEECKKNRTCIECWNQPIEGGEENG